MENPNSISGFVSKVIGSLPVVGLLARIVSDEGGVGGDLIDFAEFRRRVGKQCTIMDSRAFIEFKHFRVGMMVVEQAGEPLYVLLCCWVAAVGAGLLKSEEIFEGVARLRVSDDIEFEEQSFIALMNEAKERRSKMKSAAPFVPMEVRAEKAVDAIYICCFDKDPIEEEDKKLLSVMLPAVFPSVKREEIDRIVEAKAIRVAQGIDEMNVPDAKRLRKEAVQLQMKDLQFLQQNKDD
ncbi:Photosystem I assembly factor PSA3, chloroplastic [Linum perenne]